MPVMSSTNQDPSLLIVACKANQARYIERAKQLTEAETESVYIVRVQWHYMAANHADYL